MRASMLKIIPLMAIVVLQVAITSDSVAQRGGETFFSQGLEHQKAGRLDDALVAYEKCLSLDPRHYRALLGAGTVLHAKGDSDGAVRRFQDLVAHYPGDLKGRLYLGRANLNLGRIDEAKSLFRKILNDHPNNVSAMIGLARAEFSAGNRFTAVEYLKKASTLQPDNQSLKDTIHNLVAANREFLRVSEEEKRRKIRSSFEGAIAEASGSASGRTASSTSNPNLAVFHDILEGEVKRGVLGWSDRPRDFLSPQMPSGLGF